MKNQVIIALLSFISFASCEKKKAHSCTCAVTTTITYRYTTRNSGAVDTFTNTSTEKQETSFSKIKKGEVTKLINCTSRTETEKSHEVVSLQTGIGDKEQVNTTTYDCQVK